MPMIVMSPSFVHDGEIPARYSCDDQDVSPPLGWAGIPADARSLALIVDDPARIEGEIHAAPIANYHPRC